MYGINRLYDIIYNAGPRRKENFFLGKVTREEPIEITAFDLPVPNLRFARGIPECRTGDEVIGVFLGDEAYIIAVV